MMNHFLIAALAMTMLSSAVGFEQLLVNHKTKECLDEVSCTNQWSCTARCTPRKDWVVSSETCVEGYTMVPPEFDESDFVIYGQIRDEWHCNNCDNCKDFLKYNSNENTCSVSFCDPPPPAWGTATFPDCHYINNRPFWVGPKGIACEDPCQSITSCGDCVERGCAWAWTEQNCRPTCDSWPCITDSRDGLCQEFEEQQSLNERCEEAFTCQECSVVPDVDCRWVDDNAGRCVGSYCEGNCNELACDGPSVSMCGSNGLDIGESCPTHKVKESCWMDGEAIAKELICCCSSDSSCVYIEGNTCQIACFVETSELRAAVALYLTDPLNPSSTVAQTYGWPMNTWCVSNIEDFTGLFKGYNEFNYDISDWNMSNARDISAMFEHCAAFNQPIDNWNVSDVQSMELTFADCTNFNQDLPWDVSNVKLMGGMFRGCSSFNMPIGNWNVSRVTNTSFMFSLATSFNQAIGEWDVSSVVDMGNMFSNATLFNKGLGAWDISNVRNASHMFDHSTAFNQDLSSWKVNFTSSSRMFYGAASFSQSLCAWTSHLPEISNSSTEMFVNTNCPYQENDQVSPAKTMCMNCGRKCGEGDIGPGQQCLANSKEDVCIEDGDVVDLVCCQWRGDTYMKAGDFCFCFSGENMVIEASKGAIKMENLAVGDMVEVSHNQYERVYSFGHYDTSQVASYLQIHIRELEMPLEISPDHLIFVQIGDAVKSITASQIKLGDKVVLGEVQLGNVNSIQMVERIGAYAPFTSNDKLLVSGVLVSNYVSLLGESDALTIAPGLSVSLHWLSHVFTFHRRALLRLNFGDILLRNNGTARKEEYGDDDAMPRWVSGPRRFFVWLLSQNLAIRCMVLIPFVVYGCLVTTAEYVFDIPHLVVLTLVLIGTVSLTCCNCCIAHSGRKVTITRR